MKLVLAAGLALICCIVGFNSANAQGTAMKTTPTTKILAIGTINPGFDQSQVSAVLPEEVRETVDLYLDGKIEQWFSLQEKPGVAFIINVTDPAVARTKCLKKLPLGQKHMMSFELIPIGPLNPALRFLQVACSRNPVGDMQSLTNDLMHRRKRGRHCNISRQDCRVNFELCAVRVGPQCKRNDFWLGAEILNFSTSPGYWVIAWYAYPG